MSDGRNEENKNEFESFYFTNLPSCNSYKHLLIQPRINQPQALHQSQHSRERSCQALLTLSVMNGVAIAGGKYRGQSSTIEECHRLENLHDHLNC